MGFSVTASTLIILISLLAAGSTLANVTYRTMENVEESRRDIARIQHEAVHTDMTWLVQAPYPRYIPGAQTYEVLLDNSGDVVLRVSKLTFLINGRYWNDKVDTETVDGDATTDLWMSGQDLYVKFNTVTSNPTYFAVVAENGAALFVRV